MQNSEYIFQKHNLLSMKSRLTMFRHSRLFSNTTTFIIIFYSIILSLKTHFDDNLILYIFSILDTMVTIYFTMEIIIKLYVERNKLDFFRDGWNLFDFIIVMFSLIPLDMFESAAIARLLRIFRVLRLIAVNDNIKKILMALEGAIPAIMNIVVLMFIVFYVYAILGNQFFGNLESGLWNNFSISMLTLFRILTFEDWTDVMYEAMDINGYSWIYFISFIIINAFVIFNLFIAVIVDEISKIKDNDIQHALENEDFDKMVITKELSEIKQMLKELQKEDKNNV